MYEIITISSIVTIAVIIVIVPFIFRIYHYRKRMAQMPQRMTPDVVAAKTDHPAPPAKDIYLARYVYLDQVPIARGKPVLIRPEYYKRIERIVLVIGRNEVSFQSYVDNVLKAHFDDNRGTINGLYRRISNSSKVR